MSQVDPKATFGIDRLTHRCGNASKPFAASLDDLHGPAPHPFEHALDSFTPRVAPPYATHRDNAVLELYAAREWH